VPPYPETQKYVVEVGKRLQPARPAPAGQKNQPKPAASASEEGNHIQEIRLPDGSVRYVSRQPL